MLAINYKKNFNLILSELKQTPSKWKLFKSQEKEF